MGNGGRRHEACPVSPADARAILAIPESERGKVRFAGTNLENFSPELAKVWKTARHGDYAEVLSRNPDGTFQVIIQGQEKTRTVRDVAYMTGLEPGALDTMLGEATRQRLAQPRSPAPPIWQGTARLGHAAEVLSRNPDGTFQVRLEGVEKTFTEPRVANMTGLKKGALYEMLGEATARRKAEGARPNQEFDLPAAGLQAGDAGGLRAMMDGVMQKLHRALPGVLGRDAHLLNSAEDLFNSDYAGRRGRPFTAEEMAGIREGEGFHDPLTGQSFEFVQQVQARPGESAQQAVMRVMLHESIGHGGVNRLLAGNPKAQQQFDFLVRKILELDAAGFRALAADPAYAHLKGDARARCWSGWRRSLRRGRSCWAGAMC